MVRKRPDWIDANPLPLSAQKALKQAASQGGPHSKERCAAIDKAVEKIKRSYPHLFKWS